MNLSQPGLEILKEFESTKRDAQGRHVVYKDAAGLPTIGWGHLIRSGEKFDTPLSDDQAELLLRADVVNAEQAADSVGVMLAQHQFDALTIFAFNIGVNGFKVSTVRRYVQTGYMAGVPAAMLMWNKARSPIDGTLEPMAGLTNRREVEGVLFEHGPDKAWAKGVEKFSWRPRLSNFASDEIRHHL